MAIGGGEWFVIEEYAMVPVQVRNDQQSSRDGSENAIDGGRR